jgi:GH25 family lysozyme M1 (1,4-beta-N-acetylmuramidase)
MRTLGFDCSQWQDNPDTPAFLDFNKAVTAGAKFAIMRFSYGKTIDRIARRAYDGYKAAGMIVGAYQFADYRDWAQNSVAKLIEHLDGRKPDFLALDLEQNEQYWPGYWPSDGGRLTRWVMDWIDLVQVAFPKTPLVFYTNPDTIKQMHANAPLLAKVAEEAVLWLAWWREGEPPAQPLPWTKCTFVQPTPTAVGKQFGMESGNLDTDYFNGTEEELQIFVGKIAPPVPPSPDILVRLSNIEARLTKLEEGRP